MAPAVRKAFTLVELLVSMAVLSVVAVLFAQVFGMVAGTWSSGRAQADNFNQARIALDVISQDIEAAVIRRDLPAFFAEDAPALAFFTKQPGFNTAGKMGTRPLSLVAFAVSNVNGESILQRTAAGFDFGEDLGYSSANWSLKMPSTAVPAGIGPGVLVMRHQFIGADGLNVLPEGINTGWKKSASLPGVESLRAITISVAVIDAEGLKPLQGAGKLEQLQANFATNDPGPVRSFRSSWQAQMDQPGSPLAAGGVPKKALQRLRTFERSIMLPTLRKDPRQ